MPKSADYYDDIEDTGDILTDVVLNKIDRDFKDAARAIANNRRVPIKEVKKRFDELG